MPPTEGVTYWFDPATQAWKAPARPDIPVATTDPGSGYGSAPYGTRPFGE